jgi:hypothetical protein
MLSQSIIKQTNISKSFLQAELNTLDTPLNFNDGVSKLQNELFNELALVELLLSHFLFSTAPVFPLYLWNQAGVFS